MYPFFFFSLVIIIIHAQIRSSLTDLDEIDDNIHVSHEGGHVKWSQPRLSLALNGSSVLEQEFHYFDSVLFAGNVQRSEAVLV